MEQMSTQPVSPLAIAEYLEIERTAETRSEYLHGQISAMSRASRRHNRIICSASSLLSPNCEAGIVKLPSRTSASQFGSTTS